MTLPELLISVAIIGLVSVAISGAIVVTLRQQNNTEGRLNVARAEQSISMWIPADLASADTVNTDPGASPCGATTCGDLDLSTGSNVLMLSWTTDGPSGSVATNVSYHFRPNSSGTAYELLRIVCTGGSCTWQVVLNDLPGPPGGEPFIPGVAHGAACTREVDPVPCTRPDWVIIVSQPLRPDAISEEDVLDDEDENASLRKDANRVIVTINGGGDSEGAGGGINQISITAGGTVRREINANSVFGAPTFVEARSRCGGPMALIIDESNSIGSAIGDVKAGVQRFVEALAGTPVQLQVVRFHTYSSMLGSSDWHRYYDMTNEADVAHLLSRINDLQGTWPNTSARNGGTNWEEALFRTFYQANGSTAAVIPSKVVFFTDGVPTFDRLVHRSTPGVIPPNPPAPGPMWPTSTGSAYSQVGFNRANYIANQFRRSVRLIGVGVGADITQSSPWIADPGAGYRIAWERAYRRYQRAEGTYESNLDFERASSWISNVDFERRVNGSWVDTTPSIYYSLSSNRRINGTRGWYYITEGEYNSYRSLHSGGMQIYTWVDTTPELYFANNVDSGSTDGWRINGTRTWYPVSEAMYNAHNVHNGDSDGWRVTTTLQWVSKAVYEANNTTPDDTDGWVDTGSNQYVSAAQATDWIEWTGDRPGSADQYRSTKVYNSPPYEAYDPAQTATTKNDVILARLIAGNDHGVPAIWDGSYYTNAEIADMYVLPQWSQFSRAMEAVALGDCGGTLSLRTRLANGTPASDPFRYQNSAVTDSGGNPVALEPTVVTTNQQFTTGTFDFAIPNGQFVTVDIRPQNFSELTSYTPGAWSCKAGINDRAFTLIDLEGTSTWKGVRVQVAANEAVSCTLTVNR